MAYNFSATINVLPVVGESVQVYFQAINISLYGLSNTFSSIGFSIKYGNVTVGASTSAGFYFIPNDTDPIAFLCTATISGINYSYILYTRAVFAQQVPPNFNRLSQKIPLGIFTDINKNSIIGQVVKAKSMLADDYYQSFFDVQNQVYSSDYSPALEFEYNGTVGLLSASAFPTDLFHLFSTMVTYGLNAYDLELFVSQYIYFRLGTTSAVYIENDIAPISNVWILGVDGFSQLDQSPPETVLAGPSYNPVLQNISWTIFNSAGFTSEFEIEIVNLINRISRADIGNVVDFTTVVDPTTDGFSLKGPTYRNDPRLIFRKCLKYIDKSNYPLNIIGYQAPAPPP